MFRVKIIGRLIEQQDIGLFKQKFCEQYPGALSARKFCDITVKPEVNNAECAGNLVYFAVNIVKIMCFKTFLDFRKIFHHPGEGVLIRPAHFFAQIVHAALQVVERSESGGEDIADGHAFFKYSMLVKIAGMDIFCPFHRALIREELSCYNIHKSGFALAVCPHQPDMFPL